MRELRLLEKDEGNMLIEPEFLEKSCRKELRRQAEEFMEEADWYDDPAGYAADFALKMLRECDRLKDDLDALKNVCFHCANADDYGDPIRHFHEPEGWHWHHYLDPGDGLPDPCSNSDLLERVLADHFVQVPEMVARMRKAESDEGAFNGQTIGWNNALDAVLDVLRGEGNDR